MLAGYLFRKFSFLGEAFWRDAEALSYFVLFPALIIYRLINADFTQYEIGPLVIVCCCYFSISTLITWASCKKFLSLPHASWTSYLQGSIRFNTFIALALSDKLFGEQLFALSALIIGLFISMVNIITILAFNLESKSSVVRIGKNLAKNLLIAACFIGITLNYSQFPIPEFVSDTLSIFGRASLPLAILAVGAGLQMHSLTQINRSLIFSSLIKLIISPLLMAMLCFLFISDPMSLNLLIVFASVPTASAAYILARKLGGDAPLMASLITFQTLISAITIATVLTVIS